MSKIGRKPIDTADVQVVLKDNTLEYKGKHANGMYELPEYITVTFSDSSLLLELTDAKKKNFWGMHRALIANVIEGARKPFEKQLIINGLGYKAELKGSGIVLSLGFSHKINYKIPEGVTLVLDKSGQKLTFSSTDKQKLGQVCASIRDFRPPEPYKGTGIRYAGEHIFRKAGKAKG